LLLYNYFNIPDSCLVGNTIFKKMFYENGDLSKADKSLFTEGIDKITWVYCLKPDTINIKPYKDEIREYAEIEVLDVKLTSESKIRRISEIIMRTIPYPMVLIFFLEEKVQIWTAHQRINLSDSTKNTIEEFIYTDWIDLATLQEKDKLFFESLDIKQMSFTNFFQLYSNIVDRISVYNLHKLGIRCEELGVTGEQARELLTQIEEIDKQIEGLRAKIKKETQFNKRVEMNVELKRLEKEKSLIIGGL
jgi:hypothetical protein